MFSGSEARGCESLHPVAAVALFIWVAVGLPSVALGWDT